MNDPGYDLACTVSANSLQVPLLQLDPETVRLAKSLTNTANSYASNVNKCTGMGESGIGGIYKKNIPMNLEIMGGRLRSMRAIRGTFENDTIYLVGAGPSLEKNYQFLSRVKHSGHGYIVAVDLAADFLCQNGVTPDFVVTLESMGWKDYFTKTTEKLRGDDMVLLTISGVNPDYLKGFPCKQPDPVSGKEYPNAYFVHADVNDESGTDWYQILNKMAPINCRMACGSNVSSMALMMAYYLGASRFVFVGHDYGFYDVKKTHCGICAPYRSQLIPWHFDRDGKEVFTYIQLMLPKMFTEVMVLNMMHGAAIGTDRSPDGTKKIMSQRKCEFINATEGGIMGLEASGKELPWFKFDTLDNVTRKYSVPMWDKNAPAIVGADPKKEPDKMVMRLVS
jgi:hypothetical protein